jgi:hypothetical protein
LLEFQHPIVMNAAVATWPPAARQKLVDLKFLIPAENANRVRCPECGQHEEEVVVAQGPGDFPRYFVPCPEVMRAYVSADDLRQWAVQASAIAEALATTLGLSGRCTELAPNRLWRLGRTNWQGASRDLMFARGLQWDDAATVRAEIVRGRKPIIFVPRCLPPAGFWRRSVPPVLVLSQFTSFRDDEIEIEAFAVATAICDADAAGSTQGLVTVTEEQLKLIIRQQIKAKHKSELTDTVLVAAYRHCGTYRAAAEYLTKQIGRLVSKDSVFRAVNTTALSRSCLKSRNGRKYFQGNDFWSARHGCRYDSPIGTGTGRVLGSLCRLLCAA